MESICRHCGHRFVARVSNPAKCRVCQRPWPLGEPSDKIADDGSPYNHGYASGMEAVIAEEPDLSATRKLDSYVFGLSGHTLSAEDQADWWLGYYHGRYQARTGKVAPGAVAKGSAN